MKGFDRPLKPEWIYNCVKQVNIGDNIADYKQEFDRILWELDGKEGKRKVRTVLSRYYLRSQDNPKSRTVEYTPVIELCKKHTLEEIQPLLLFYLMMRSSMIRTLTRLIYDLYGTKKDIDYSYLRKKTITKFGERDISPRSLRNLLTTLTFFNILQREKNIYKWKKPLYTNERNVCYMLKFYAEEYRKTPQIFLDDLEEYLFIYFKTPNINEIARKYNKRLWEYSQNLSRKQIMFHESYKWDI